MPEDCEIFAPAPSPLMTADLAPEGQGASTSSGHHRGHPRYVGTLASRGQFCQFVNEWQRGCDMTLKSMRIFAATVAFAVAAGSGAAQAALITGHLDPLFGGTDPLSGLYITGTEDFTVANDCLGGSAGFVSPSGGCGMDFIGATINFYKPSLTNPLADFLGTATFPGDSQTHEDPILGFDVDGHGNVTAVQSTVIGSAKFEGYTLDIQFGYTDLFFNSSLSPGEVGANDPTFTSLANLPALSATTLYIDPGTQPDPCNVGGYGPSPFAAAGACPASAAEATSFQTFVNGGVPEPATWAMTLVGIGAIGAAMRRRRTALAVA